MEGVAIRARIKEQTEGEQASSSLIGKQNANRIKPKICKIKTEYSDGSCPNVVLNSQESISKYVSSYYQSLYDETVTDKGKQDWFLSFVVSAQHVLLVLFGCVFAVLNLLLQ